MRFLTSSVILAAALLGAAAPAATLHSVRDGDRTFRYTATRNADGTVSIVGEDAITGTPFTFTVNGVSVHGTMNGQPVSFSVPRRTALALRQQVVD